MNRQELNAEFDKLNAQIQAVKERVGRDSDEVAALACQQICVSICGSLEQQLKAILVEHTKRNSNSKIHRPVFKLCESYQNPKITKIVELIGLFDDDFAKSLKERWDEEDDIEKDHINNLVADRITIAHRKKSHIQVGIVKLENYYKAYKSLCSRIYNHFLEA